MSVEFAPEPLGSRDALAEGLNALVATPTPMAVAHIAATAGAEAPPPLPVYFFRLDDLAAGKDPRGGAPTAWMYLLVTGNHPVRTAEVVALPAGGYTFAAISSAPAAGTAEAIRVAEADPVAAHGRYQMRLLRVPALYVTALWLKDQNGDADHFVVIPPAPDKFQSHKVIKAGDFLRMLEATAGQKAQAIPPPFATSPTN